MPRKKTVLEGTTVRSSVVFKDANGTAVDPQAVRVTWKAPSTADETYIYPTATQLIRTSTGNYYCERSMGAGSAGVWYTRWESGGLASAETWFTVKAPAD